MSLKVRLMEDLKSAMKSKDTVKKNTITMIRAEIKQEEVDKRIELGEADIIEIISRQLKERKNAIDDFKKGDRQDLVDQTNQEIDILLQYLPQQLTVEEIKSIVAREIKKLEAKSMKDMGLVMKSVMLKVKGRADGKIVNEIVKDSLK